MPNDDVRLSKKRWESIYKKQPQGKENYKNDPTVKSYKKFLDRYGKDIKKGIFLDLGCGKAYVSALLAKEKVSVLGIDISKEAIQQSKKLFRSEKLNGRFIQGDLLDLSLKDNSVNFIWSCMSLEYVRDTQKAINECFRVLRKGGKIIAVVPVVSLTTLSYHQLRGDIPNIPFLKQVMEWIHLKLLKGRYMHYGYEQSFTPGQLKKMFTNAGFKVKKIDFFDMYYPIAFVPNILRPLAQNLLKYRLFWPLVYVEADK